MDFLPICKDDLKQRGWEQLDIILVSGDAYVDHPAWAAAILGRFLEKQGYRVGIIAQPDWRSLDDFKQLGKPRLYLGVSGGNLDSMVNHYTADLKKRHEDLYSPGGKAGHRPDRATIVYANRLREAYPGVPIVIGGVEASLRRLAHYDYWSDQLRRSILLDSKADLLVYGMGEYKLLEIARFIENGGEIKKLDHLTGTAYISSTLPQNALELPSYERVKNNLNDFSQSTRLVYQNNNPYCSSSLAQKHGDRWVVVNPPALPLSSKQMDKIYDIPFLRRYHPVYEEAGGIPALKPVQFSILTHRGCFGGCSFCSIGLHQGKVIQSRSIKSLLAEAESFVAHPDFRGSIPDLGAASANMYGMSGIKGGLCEKCQRTSCLYPSVCQNLATDHSESLRLWDRMRRIKGVANIRVASGVRYDLILQDKSGQYLRELCKHHVGGQLKIAPEHVSETVTRLMGKPDRSQYEKFIAAFQKVNQKLNKEQYLIPYFISAHPGSSLRESIELAEFLRDHMQYYPEQVQNFTPTPMTISTSMYYTGINPVNGKQVYVAKSSQERKAQRALLQYRKPANQQLVKETLEKCGRSDLIGTSPRALVKVNTSSDRPQAAAFIKGNNTAKRTRRSKKKQ
ncbi:MAG: YgiQ family radical SAM protein [Syntrophomonadaceae bacterium]|nr:YgiQ family radical SAM protein [Syntrophomonadaceae bacterium]